MSEMGACWVVLNYTCNNSCSWCYARGKLHSGQVMTLKTLKASLNLLQELGVKEVTYIGGDPTVNPNLPEAIRMAKDRGLEPTVVTNGRALANESYTRKLREAGLSMVTISIEGFSPAKHDEITQRQGSYSETLAGVKVALTEGLFVTTSTTISMRTINEVESLAWFLAGLGVKTLGFNVVTPDIETPVFEDGFSLRAIICKMKELVSQESSLGARVYISASVPLCMVEDNGEVDSHFRGKCFVPFGDALAIDIDGMLIPCVHWIDSPVDTIFNEDGSRKTVDQFLDNWNNGEPAEFRRMLRSTLPSEQCIECRHNKVCLGGCPLQRLGRSLEEEIALARRS